jgi:glycosyltransferase involved in cell wall biosynthesis
LILKVALDSSPLGVPTGGITRYAAQLLLALKSEFPDDCFEALESDSSSFITRRWWSAGLPLRLLREGFDLFHGTDFAVPYVPVCPSVMTLHDLSPWKNEPWRAPSARVHQRTPYLLQLGLASMVITPTEAIRREAISYFRIHPDRVVAVPLAAADHLQPVEAPPPSVPYFVCLGVLEPRKNLPILVDAWRELRKTHPVDLVLAGRRRFDAPAIGDEPGLIVKGQVPEQELAALLSGATALVFPSSYEGFGLPVLEAMQCGCPVIASNDPALREVSGGAALHTDSFLEAMAGVLESPAMRSELREAGLRRAAEFSWSRTAQLTYEVYEEARRRF